LLPAGTYPVLGKDAILGQAPGLWIVDLDGLFFHGLFDHYPGGGIEFEGRGIQN